MPPDSRGPEEIPQEFPWVQLEGPYEITQEPGVPAEWFPEVPIEVTEPIPAVTVDPVIQLEGVWKTYSTVRYSSKHFAT
jgi:hypothetical protein